MILKTEQQYELSYKHKMIQKMLNYHWREQESIKNPQNKYVYARFSALVKYSENFYGIFMSKIDTPSFFKHKPFWILS